MKPRFLINNDGAPFESSEVHSLRDELDAMGNETREEYRNRNASEIAQHDADKFLIVSGPGTGKSHLFLEKIKQWYRQDPNAKVFVTSFVRKLVLDLENDIRRDENLTDNQKSGVTVSTLHGVALNIVARSGGTRKWQFKPHFKIIGKSWEPVVWDDVLAFLSRTERGTYERKEFERQWHDNDFDDSDDWVKIKETYLKLCQFYNAAGFADLILRAAIALAENPDLNKHDYFIIDEYQDFNVSENLLIRCLIQGSKGQLIVGDDEQVLYEMKSSKPNLIQALYSNPDYTNGMLPFCGRSSYRITKSADYFVRHQGETNCIEKIYLPLEIRENDPKVQVIACHGPSTVVNYIENFISDHRARIDERKAHLESGEEKDAYLLILTPAKELNFYSKYNSNEKLKAVVREHQVETRSFSEDYYKILNYCYLAKNLQNNFTFRKVLKHEGIPTKRVHDFLNDSIQNERNLMDSHEQEIVNAIAKANEIKSILETESPATDKLNKLTRVLPNVDKANLKTEIAEAEIACFGRKEEQEAELEEFEVARMGAVELLTIIGSKGLSADHVFIIGFDNVNMGYVTENAFYVAMTRARKSLHLITALRSGGANSAHNFLGQLPDDHIEFYKYKKGDRSKTPLRGKQDFKDCVKDLRWNNARK